MNVTVQGVGIVRSVTEKTEVKALVSGRGANVFIENEQQVLEGDTVLIVQSDKLSSQRNLLQKQIKEKRIL